MTTCGYFGVIIPDYNYYQGFFLHEEAIKAAPEYLENLRREIISFPGLVKDPAPGISDADQTLLGALCATLVEGAKAQSEIILYRIGGAISVLTDSKYFMVRAKIEKGGTHTAFWRMPDYVKSPEEARDYIHSTGGVQLIQGELLKEAADLVLNDRKKH